MGQRTGRRPAQVVPGGRTRQPSHPASAGVPPANGAPRVHQHLLPVVRPAPPRRAPRPRRGRGLRPACGRHPRPGHGRGGRPPDGVRAAGHLGTRLALRRRRATDAHLRHQHGHPHPVRARRRAVVPALVRLVVRARGRGAALRRGGPRQRGGRARPHRPGRRHPVQLPLPVLRTSGSADPAGRWSGGDDVHLVAFAVGEGAPFLRCCEDTVPRLRRLATTRASGVVDGQGQLQPGRGGADAAGPPLWL
jgi:hypothetical protein